MNRWNCATKVGESRIHGLGRFAGQAIAQGDVVLIIMGRILPNQPGNQRIPIRGTSYVIDCEQTHINHSDYPNLQLEGQIVFKASRDIAEGEELTLDYGTLTTTRLPFMEK